MLFWTDSYSEAQGAGLVLEMLENTTSIHGGSDLANVLCVQGSTCGDGVCTGAETVKTCASDCPLAWTQCGDGVCAVGETELSCAVDCSSSCGNGVCSADEDEDSCYTDCCVRTCSGRNCGADGCGGQCGACTNGEQCDDIVGLCRPYAASLVGTSCDINSDCDDVNTGKCLRVLTDGTEFSGGYCAMRCSSERACPTGTACRTVDLVDWCVATCASDAACREGYLCDAGVCWPDG